MLQVSCLKETLSEKLKFALQGITGRSIKPISDNVLIEGNGGLLSFATSDLEWVETRQTIAADVTDAGAVTVHARLLSEIVAALPNGEDVMLQGKENNGLRVSCVGIAYELPGMPVEDFLQMGEVAGQRFVIDKEELAKTLQRTSFAAVKSGSAVGNQILESVLFDFGESVLKVVATDSYRLAVQESALSVGGEGVKVLVPGRALGAIEKMLKSGAGDEVEIVVSDTQIEFGLGDSVIASRLTQGQYVKWEGLLEDEAQWTIMAGVGELESALKRNTVVSKNDDYRVRMMLEDGMLRLLSKEPGVGRVRESVAVEVLLQDEVAEMGFNARYLMEALRGIGEGSVEIQFRGPDASAVVEKVGDENYKYLLMPMTIFD